VRWGAAVAALAVLALIGCGGDERTRRSAPPASSPDDAFVVRFYAHQQVGAELLRTAGPKVRGADVEPLVEPMQELREGTVERLEPYRERAGAPASLADLGVSQRQAAEDVTPAALDGVRPLTPAFLATMVRHDQGAIALLRAELERGRDPGVQAFARERLGQYTRELEDLNRAIAALQQTE
jgi:uncharacterized protein (DUF305 family)